MSDVPAFCQRASQAARALCSISGAQKDALLRAMAAGLRARADLIVAANAADVRSARQEGRPAAFLDRLALDPVRVEHMARAAERVASFEDPIGSALSDWTRPDGLRVRRVRVPLGVVAIIYESRPNVGVEASALALKASNAVILRGGSEASRSNAAIGDVMGAALDEVELPRDLVQVFSGDHDAVAELVRQEGLVDLVVARGGAGLVHWVRDHARVPVIAHASGVCHLFVDEGADVEMAVRLAVNAKLQRPGVCNALECLLVDATDAERTLPPIARALLAGGCELRGCERTRRLVPGIAPATDDDWGREYLDRILSVRVVDGIDAALAHVARYGSRHTEAICTADPARAERFRREVDAACVVVNASTRLHDGEELGLGAEIGICTSKLHWRGAMGLEGLTTFQWRLDGDGQVRQ